MLHLATSKGVKALPFSEDAGKPLELINGAIKSIGFTDGKIIEALETLLQSAATLEVLEFEPPQALSDEVKRAKAALQPKIWEAVRKEFDRLEALNQNPTTFIIADDTRGDDEDDRFIIGQQVYGHHMLTVHVAIGEKTFLADFRAYPLKRVEPSAEEKAGFFRDFIAGLPEDMARLNTLFLAFNAEELIKPLLDKGCGYIGGIKLYENGWFMTESGYDDLVNREKSEKLGNWLVYEYVGPVAGVDKAKVLITKPERDFGDWHAKGFLVSNVNLSAQDSFKRYEKRRRADALHEAMDDIGFRGHRGITRMRSAVNLLWVYALLRYICVEGLGKTEAFSKGFWALQSIVEDNELWNMYTFAQHESIEEFLRMFS
jgi:hypothetical protein